MAKKNRMRFIAKNGAIREKIALLRANQIARITCDFKMGVINNNILPLENKIHIFALPCNILYIGNKFSSQFIRVSSRVVEVAVYS